MKAPSMDRISTVLLSCRLCGEVRFAQLVIRMVPSEEQPHEGHLHYDIHVEIDPRDADIVARFGMTHREPTAMQITNRG